MPVVLPSQPATTKPPAPPHAWIWLVAFVIVMAAGATATILLWKESNPTSAPTFWLCVIAFPALAWCLMLGLRLYYYEDEKNRIAAECAVFQADTEEAIFFGREPLAVLGAVYLCALERGKEVAAIVGKKSVLKPGVASADNDLVRFTSLELFEHGELPGRYRALFVDLLKEIEAAVLALPARAPFEIRLQLPEATDRAALLKTFSDCWAAANYPPASASLLDPSQGLMAVDEWLDIEGGPQLENITLFVAAQLHDTPLENSAEAGVAIFLGWAPLMARLAIGTTAIFHRPVAADTANNNIALRTALQWGSMKASDAEDVWQSALAPEDKSFLLGGSFGDVLAVAQNDGYAGIYDVDSVIGHAGAASAWLAVALAVEAAWDNGRPQLVATRESSLRFAVIHPAERKNKTEAE